MANKISKVVYGDQTLIDISEDTVQPQYLQLGYTAHGSDGEQIVGTGSAVYTVAGRSGDVVLEAADINYSPSGSYESGTIGSALQSKKDVQIPVNSPSASGESFEFISAISQDSQGVISPSMAALPVMIGAASASPGTSGLVPAAPSSGYNTKYLRADGTWEVPPDTHQTIIQDGITGSSINRFCICSADPSSSSKYASIALGSFSLESGARVTVLFQNANTAQTPQLNVDGTGLKNIYAAGAQITNGENKSLLKGVIDFVYDGTQYHIVNGDYSTQINDLIISIGLVVNTLAAMPSYTFVKNV